MDVFLDGVRSPCDEDGRRPYGFVKRTGRTEWLWELL